MPKPAFFVDGFTEQRILQALCPTGVFRRLNMNGKDVKISAIAKAIHLQFRLLNNKCYPVVVLVDREQRDISCDEMIDQLKIELQLLDLPMNQFHFGVCDRMIENWILADQELIFEKFGRVKNVGDGDHGKGVLRSFFSRDVPYQETVHGVELMLEASAARISQRSASFANFVNNFPLNCYWLAG